MLYLTRMFDAVWRILTHFYEKGRARGSEGFYGRVQIKLHTNCEDDDTQKVFFSQLLYFPE
jgi:hypothetical protein